MNRSPLDLKDIECPVCLELMGTWIYMCENGHGICYTCKPKLTDCPICKGKLTDERKHDAEMLSLGVKHHCKYETSGCTELNFLAEMKNHKEQCLYRHRECPLGTRMCEEEVDPSVAKDHILEDHAELVTHRPVNITSILHTIYSYEQTKVLVKGDDMFIVNVQVPNVNNTSDMIVSCTYVGSVDDARKYKYTITLYGEKSYRMLSYTSHCLSYLELLEREKNADTFILLPHAVFQKFLSIPVQFCDPDVCGSHIGLCEEGHQLLKYKIEVDKI